jgi:large subunit ribosomal protein L29
MKVSEIRGMGTQEIQAKLDEAYESLYKMRFQAAIGQLEDLNRVGFVRRDIARMKTVLRERELAARAQGGAR